MDTTPVFSPEPSMRARRLRGSLLLAWMLAVVGCFLPLVLGLSPARAILALASALVSPGARDTFFIDRPTQILLLALALGACSPLLALPWRLAFGWRSPESAATRATGGVLRAALLAVTGVAFVELLVSVGSGDSSSLPPLAGMAVGLLSLLTLLLPKWRRLPPGSRLVGALDAGYLACVLGALATTSQSPTPAWWLLAAGALTAALELSLLPRLE